MMQLVQFNLFINNASKSILLCLMVVVVQAGQSAV